jgi:hypothetical protein
MVRYYVLVIFFAGYADTVPYSYLLLLPFYLPLPAVMPIAIALYRLPTLVRLLPCAFPYAMFVIGFLFFLASLLLPWLTLLLFATIRTLLLSYHTYPG